MTTSHTIEITAHAVQRYQQRVRPSLSIEAAEDELARVALVGEVLTEPPAWHLRSCARLAPFYLCLADVVLPLTPHRGDPGVLVATTCLAKGSLSTDSRRYRTARRRRSAARSGARTLSRSRS
ncbi:MAG: hypothetical protein WKF96_08820 [Solirubrobacteraceae bacterium]